MTFPEATSLAIVQSIEVILCIPSDDRPLRILRTLHDGSSQGQTGHNDALSSWDVHDEFVLFGISRGLVDRSFGLV